MKNENGMSNEKKKFKKLSNKDVENIETKERGKEESEKDERKLSFKESGRGEAAKKANVSRANGCNDDKQGNNTKKNRLILAISGIATGFANGFFGGGGGMITVPVFSKLLKYEEKKAHATALLVILPISIFSSISYVFKGSLDWGITGLVAVGVLIGGIIGAVLLKKITNKALSYVFAIIMIGVGTRMMF